MNPRRCLLLLPLLLAVPLAAQTGHVLPRVNEVTWGGNNGSGTGLGLALTSAPASQPALGLLGFDLTSLLAGVGLPLDLGGVGMTGCSLLVRPTITLPGVTDAAGSLAVPLAIPPDPTLEGRAFGMQWLHGDPSMPNPAGLVVTHARHVIIGPIICANRYVWELFDETRPTGSLQAGGPIARITTLP